MLIISYLKKLLGKRIQAKFGKFGVGVRVSLKKGLYICPSNIYVGNYVSLGPDTYLFATKQSKIEIKDGTIIGPRCKVYTRNHNYDSNDLEAIPYDHVQLCADVTINEAVWIGESVIILPGVTIGKGAVIGAGCVVSKDIPDYAVAVGNPAKVVKYRNAAKFDQLLQIKSFSRTQNKKKDFVRK